MLARAHRRTNDRGKPTLEPLWAHGRQNGRRSQQGVDVTAGTHLPGVLGRHRCESDWLAHDSTPAGAKVIRASKFVRQVFLAPKP